MSKIGKQPITVPEGVEVKINDGIFDLKGKAGEISVKSLPFIETKLENNVISFSVKNNSKQAKANWGTLRALVQNAITGVSEGFTKNLIIEGVGFRATMEGEFLVLNVGLSHPVKIVPPAGIKISVEKNLIKISGVDKDLVGKIAASIRAVKKPEPYKGKGIRYEKEIIKRKAGKKVAGTTTK